MTLYEQILTENDCYKRGRVIRPRGVMVHSTGADNPHLKRYVQPDDGLLGVNRNGNHWNRPGVSKCVHAFIGRLEDGTVAVYQTLPWDRRGWHAGGGANDTHIGFEICEDGLDDEEYFRAVYRAAVELTAHLCTLYGLDPLDGVSVISHYEGWRLGLATGHGDIDHWLKLYGLTMDDFRDDVAKEMEGSEMTQEQFDKMMDDYLERLAKKEPSAWSGEAREWAETNGVIKGDGQGNRMYKKFCTRDELAQMLFNLKG